MKISTSAKTTTKTKKKKKKRKTFRWKEREQAGKTRASEQTNKTQPACVYVWGSWTKCAGRAIHLHVKEKKGGWG